MFSLVFLNMQSNQEFMFMLFDKQIEYILGTFLECLLHTLIAMKLLNTLTIYKN